MSRPWMPLYVADYLADTGHLSTVEHGAYMLLIMHYWQKGGLPDDDKRLASIARASLEQWSDIRPALAEFFAAGWKHVRIDEELEKAAKAYEKRASAGRAGGSAKAAKASNATAMLEHEPDNALPSTITEEEKGTPSGVPKKRATRLPDDFEPDLDVALANGLDLNEFQIERLQFLDYWRSKAGQGATKTDWPATWRVWVRNVVKKRRHQPRAGPPSFPPKPRNAGEDARLELRRRGEYPDATSPRTRHLEEGDGNTGFAGSGIARRIAIASGG